MFEQVHTSVLQFGPFTEQELTLLTERLKFTSCKRQSGLLKKGQICKALFEDDPTLEKDEHRLLAERIRMLQDERSDIS